MAASTQMQMQMQLYKKNKSITVNLRVGDHVRWSLSPKVRFVKEGRISEILGPCQFVFETEDGQMRGNLRGVSVVNGRHVLDYPYDRV